MLWEPMPRTGYEIADDCGVLKARSIGATEPEFEFASGFFIPLPYGTPIPLSALLAAAGAYQTDELVRRLELAIDRGEAAA